MSGRNEMIGDELEAVEEQIDHELTERRSTIRNWLNETFWQRVPLIYRQNIEPEVLSANLLDDEVKQLEIHLAWYRDLLANLVYGYFFWWLGAAIVLTVILLVAPVNSLYALAPFGLLLIMMIEGGREFLEYHQWRLIKTNKRLIISLPQHGAWPLVDNIEMGDLPKVIDANWSPNPVWRLFQFFTGARDVYISLTAFKFEEGTARVRDALIIPDVMPDDVFALKQLVFGKK